MDFIKPTISHKVGLKPVQGLWIVIKYFLGERGEGEEEEGEGKYPVNLGHKMCSCKKWQLCGIPCIHAMSAIACQGEEVEIYVDKYYHISTYMKVYERVVNL